MDEVAEALGMVAASLSGIESACEAVARAIEHQDFHPPEPRKERFVQLRPMDWKKSPRHRLGSEPEMDEATVLIGLTDRGRIFVWDPNRASWTMLSPPEELV